MTSGYIPLWIGGDWNPEVSPYCRKCLEGKPHLFLWNNKEKKWKPVHDDHVFNTEDSYK